MVIQQWSDDVLMVELTDEPDFSEDMTEIGERTKDACCDVVVDLSGLKHLSSSGLSKLLRLRKRVLGSGRHLFLCAPCDHVWEIFIATGLDGIFDFARSVTEALTRLQSGKK